MGVEFGFYVVGFVLLIGSAAGIVTGLAAVVGVLAGVAIFLLGIHVEQRRHRVHA